ncbi:hypothetical protein F4805DRAFT_263239 [Annulohypoxylon moriforme]|nr:hypothetical protein F4805DRAFT_263239 [Annulohypoxylon moriforme]
MCLSDPTDRVCGRTLAEATTRIWFHPRCRKKKSAWLAATGAQLQSVKTWRISELLEQMYGSGRSAEFQLIVGPKVGSSLYAELRALIRDGVLETQLSKTGVRVEWPRWTTTWTWTHWGGDKSKEAALSLIDASRPRKRVGRSVGEPGGVGGDPWRKGGVSNSARSSSREEVRRDIDSVADAIRRLGPHPDTLSPIPARPTTPPSAPAEQQTDQPDQTRSRPRQAQPPQATLAELKSKQIRLLETLKTCYLNIDKTQDEKGGWLGDAEFRNTLEGYFRLRAELEKDLAAVEAVIYQQW